MKSITPAARGLGIDVRVYEVRSEAELEQISLGFESGGFPTLYQ
jgi:hypothetical protein